MLSFLRWLSHGSIGWQCDYLLPQSRHKMPACSACRPPWIAPKSLARFLIVHINTPHFTKLGRRDHVGELPSRTANSGRAFCGAAAGSSCVLLTFTVLDDRSDSLDVQCEIDTRGSEVLWRAELRGPSSVRGMLEGRAVTVEAVRGHIQAEVFRQKIRARN